MNLQLIIDPAVKLHPRYLKDQVRKEILFSLDAFPVIDILTLPLFLGDVRGYSMLYDSVAEGPFGAQGGWKPWAYMIFSAMFFLWLTDFCIYWIHRWLHLPVLYKRLHKPHHKWISESAARPIELDSALTFPRAPQSLPPSLPTPSTPSTASSSRYPTICAATSSRFTSTCSSACSLSSTSGASL